MSPRLRLPSLRVGLGCMRLSTEPHDEASARATLLSALDAGVRLFDTARAYGPDEASLGHNERLLAAVLAEHPAGAEAFVVTKGGMARPGGGWRPDGRASSLRADCEASVAALGRPIDLYLVHAPDPSVAWPTTVRALAKLQADGLVRAVGVCNVNLAALDAALELAPIAAVQVALSALDDTAIRSGVVARCLDRGVAVLAHTPLGGVKRAPKLGRSAVLEELGQRHGVSAHAAALAAVLDLGPGVYVLPGARRPETARDIASAGRVRFSDADRAALRETYRGLSPPKARLAAPAPAEHTGGEVVLVMGLQGAGKSTWVSRFVAEGYHRLNRDELGGTLDRLADRVHALLGEGVRRIVLDNTYVSRAARARVLEAAARRGATVRGVWLDTPLHEAQVNVINRMLAAHGRLLSPDELRRGKDNTALAPTAQLRMLRELEPPALEEGFAALDVVASTRPASSGAPALLVALEAVGHAPPPAGRPTLVFGWRPGATDAELEALRVAGAELAVCTHEAGPPRCWCRPPLPGLLLAFARAHGVDLRASELHGVTDTHQVMAGVVGARWVSHG